VREGPQVVGFGVCFWAGECGREGEGRGAWCGSFY
jgi:hypothetical protein